MNPSTYSVPLAQRRIENLHIVFWLLKDISWCMVWRPLGMAMIVPTLGAAIFIAWRARGSRIDFAHNLAVVFWIGANAWWMTSEFFGIDEKPLLFGIDGRHLSMVPFLIGAAILAWHYIGLAFRARPGEPRLAGNGL